MKKLRVSSVGTVTNTEEKSHQISKEENGQKGKVFLAEMQRLPDADCDENVNGGQFSSKEKVEFIEALHNSIWPATNTETFLTLLDEGGKECLDMRHGARHETCLHRSCRFGKKKLATILLDRGASVSVRNNDGSTPLHLACEYGYKDIVMILVDKGAPLMETDNSGNAPLHWAAKRGDMKVVCALYRTGGCPKQPGERGNNMLHCAASKGRMELVDYLLKNVPHYKENPSCKNDVGETPLHLAAAFFKADQKGNRDTIECLLDAGADLNARTDWGDTAFHYAALKGTYQVLRFLCEEGIDVHKPAEYNRSFEDYFSKHSITQEDAEMYQYTFLQKVAKSGCIVKSTYILEKIMDARTAEVANLYFYNNESNACKAQLTELNDQEQNFAAMAKELACFNGNRITFQMFLQHCPDAITYLFDRCLMSIGKREQVQGNTYLDLFLFNPSCPSRCASELKMIGILVECGKEKFLIHPLIEIFLKLKWNKTWFLYTICMVFFAAFFVALAGYALAHYGSIYSNISLAAATTTTNTTTNSSTSTTSATTTTTTSTTTTTKYAENGTTWWYLLAVLHAFYCFAVPPQMLKIFILHMSMRQIKKNRKDTYETFNKSRTAQLFCQLLVKYFINPLLVGLVLYGRDAICGDWGVRVGLAFSIIITSYLFLSSLGTLPWIGSHTNMISKVLATVLSFFCIYIWHFMAYAIAFHILLPRTAPFKSFDIAVIKVLTMLLGEYNYTTNFVTTEDASVWSKLLFILFVMDMSVVLMNLILGMAVSDIDALQKTSAIKRMLNECLIVKSMEGFFMFVGGVMPFMDRFSFSRVTSEKVAMAKEFTYLMIVDLDKSPCNRIVTASYPDKAKCFVSPHHIVVNVIKILEQQIRQNKLNEEPEALQQTRDTQNIIKDQHREIMTVINDMKEQIKEIKSKIEK